jgi:PAS domain S-box-containing protein
MFAPLLALLGAGLLFATLAVAIAAYREPLFLLAGACGALVGVLATVQLYRQTRERQAAHRELRQAEAHVGQIVESAMDPIISVDHEQRIVVFNAAAEEAFRCTQDAVLGQPLDILLPERFRGVHRSHVQRFGRTGVTARRMGAQAILSALRATGEEFPIEASISRHEANGRNLYTVILRDVSERVRAEEALRRSKRELQALGAAAQIAREQEKHRIARELHDELGQALTMLQMDLAWCKSKTPAAADEFAAKLGRMETLLKSTVAATRRIAADLRPLMLDDLGLVPALEWLVQTFSQRTGTRCELTLEGAKLELQSAHSSAVFRIVQEALTNVAKHARASSVEVALRRENGEIVVRIRDDGVGFSPQAPHRANAFGLVSIRERASMLDGAATVTSAAGQGTTVEVRLPFAQEGAA